MSGQPEHGSRAMRIVTHPGATLPERILVRKVNASRTEAFVVPQGHDVIETVHRHLDALDAAGGVFLFVKGVLERLTLMTGGAGSGDMPMSFRGPHTLLGPLRVIAGAAMCGTDTEGARLTHCHAVFDDATGSRVGGHLLIEKSIAGEGGVHLELTILTGARMRQRTDSETCFAIFHPEEI